MRESNNIDKREQDIAKEYWLCGTCEDLFSNWEREFANKVFYHSVNAQKSIIIYQGWMSRFCASLSWRTLTYIRSLNIKEDKPKEYIESINKAERQLSKYLLGKSDDLYEFEQHLFPIGEIESTTETGLPANMNRYFLRTMSMDIIGNKNNTFIYTKLPSFILLGFVKGSIPKEMRSSRIALEHGKLSPQTYHFPDGFINYLVDKANMVNKLGGSINPTQQARIDEFVKNNPEKVVHSKTFWAFVKDRNLLVTFKSVYI